MPARLAPGSVARLAEAAEVPGAAAPETVEAWATAGPATRAVAVAERAAIRVAALLARSAAKVDSRAEPPAEAATIPVTRTPA